MHEASFEKMRAFRSAYVTPRDCSIRVLDVGAGTGEEALSYSALFEPPDFKYVGLDYAHGPNVDVVPADPFSWDELETEGFDLVLLGKTVEHTPFFWITAAEVARVLVPGGLVAIIAPSAGRVHRLPLDCWRFYPDSWPALCAYVGLDLAESFIDYPAKDRPIGGQAWNDAMMVGRKPDPGPGYYDRLAAIVATRPIDRILSEPAPGPAAEAYRAAHTLDHPALTPRSTVLRPPRTPPTAVTAGAGPDPRSLRVPCAGRAGLTLAGCLTAARNEKSTSANLRPATGVGLVANLHIPGAHVWVTNADIEATNAVTKLDAATGAFVQGMGLAAFRPMAVDSDGTHVWLAFYDGLILEFDASTGILVGNVPFYDMPRGITSDGSRVWVTGNLGQDVTVFPTSY